MFMKRLPKTVVALLLVSVATLTSTVTASATPIPPISPKPHSSTTVDPSGVPDTENVVSSTTVEETTTTSSSLVSPSSTTSYPDSVFRWEDSSPEVLRQRYGSLTSAMIGVWSGQQDPTSFFSANRSGIAEVLQRPTVASLEPVSFVELQKVLETSGVAPSFNNGFVAYSQQLASKAQSIENSVASAGAGWAQRLETLTAPQLLSPNVPQSDVSAQTAALFGMLLERTTTAFATDFPDLYSQVVNTRISNPQALAAWDRSMEAAFVASQPDRNDGLLAPCQATLMAALSSGQDPRLSSDCGQCAATGIYLNRHMRNVVGGVGELSANEFELPPTDFQQLPLWQQNLVVQQNPAFGKALLDQTLEPKPDCYEPGVGSNVLNQIVPNLWDRLKTTP